MTKDKWLYFPIICFSAILLIKIFQWLPAARYFHLHTMQDFQIAYVHFLVKYGYYQLVPNWWNGFILFRFYSPAWYFMAAPIYLLTNSLEITSYIGILLNYVLGFILIFLLGKVLNLSTTKRIAFFLLFFVNAFVLDLVKVGRIVELFAWVVFIAVFTLILRYKDRKIDKKWIWVVPAYALLMLSHIFVFVVSSFLTLGLFLTKNKKEKIIILLSMLLVFLITAFWWVPFLNHFATYDCTVHGCYQLKNEMLNTGSIVSFNTIILLGWLIIFYFYYRDRQKSKKELLFYSPLIILNLAMLTRIIVFIPILNEVPVNPYSTLFLFIGIFLFLKTRFPKKLRKVIIMGIIVLTISSGILTFTYMDDALPMEHNRIEKEAISMFHKVEGEKLIVLMPNQQETTPELLISYASVYYDVRSPQGRATATPEIELLYKLDEAEENLDKGNCEGLRENMEELKTDFIMSLDESCETLKRCGLETVDKRERVCLFYKKEVL